MKPSKHIIIVFIALTLASCAGVREIPFASESWTVNATTGNIENAGSRYSFTLCTDVIEPDLPVIGSEAEARNYNGLQLYLNRICAQLEVDCDSILLYAPTHGLMIVETAGDKQWKPRSLSSNLQEERPYTAWVRDDDTEDWNRKPDEIYTNVILDKREKQLLVVDRLTYKNRNLAIIRIIQTRTPKFKSIGLPASSGTWADVTDPTCLEPISNWIEGHRKFAIENYRLGLSR